MDVGHKQHATSDALTGWSGEGLVALGLNGGKSALLCKCTPLE